MKKKVKLIAVPYEPEKVEVGMYVIDDGELIQLKGGESTSMYLDDVDTYTDGGKFVQFYLVSDDKTNLRKVIATPEQIGWIIITQGIDSVPLPVIESGNAIHNISRVLKSIEVNELQSIIDNNGECEIETEMLYISGSKEVPKLINNKVIIYLTAH